MKYLKLMIAVVILTILPTQSLKSETFQAGSYIIDMGVIPQTYNNGLKPYGMVYDMVINKEVPLYWIIRHGKRLWEKDFTYSCTHNGTTVTKDYMAGSLVLPAAYVTEEVENAIASWKAQGVVIDGPVQCDFDAPAYNYISSFPNAVLDQQNHQLTEGLFYDHTSIPDSYWSTGTPADITVCCDVYALPHADPQKWSEEDKQTYLSYTNSKQQNFLWQGCHSVGAVEAHAPYLNMNILTTNGQIAWKKDPDYTLENKNTPPYDYDLSAGDHPIMQIASKLDGSSGGGGGGHKGGHGGGGSSALLDGSQKIYIPRPDSAWRSTTTVAIWDPDNINKTLNGGNPNKAALIAFGRAFGDPENGVLVQQASHTATTGTEAENVSSGRIYGNLLLQASIEKRPIVTIHSPSDLYYPNSYEMNATVARGAGPFVFNWSIACEGAEDPGTFTNQNDVGRSSTVLFTPNNNTLGGCILRVKVRDYCGRKNFDTKIVGITGYNPPIGYLNVTHAGEDFSNSGGEDPLDTKHPANSLYTQISGKPFGVRLVSLGADKVTPSNRSGSVILQMIDTAGISNLDPSSCDKASILSSVGGYTFNDSQTVDVSGISYPNAIKKLGFRLNYYEFAVPSGTSFTYGIPDTMNKSDLDGMFPNCASDCPSAPPGDWGCYECIATPATRGGYGTAVCARDNFAVRPESYSIGLYGTTPFIGGRSYPFEINATTHSNANDSMYSDNFTGGVVNNRIFNAPTEANITSVLVIPSGCTSLSGSNPEVYSHSIAFFNGIGRKDDNNPLDFNYTNVGNINITAVENKWIASSDDTDKDYSGGTPYEINDCIVGSSSNTPDANGKIGCMLAGTKSNITFVPSRFNNTLRVQDHNTASNFTYIADSNGSSTSYGAKINITYTAVLDDNTTAATNYTAGCYANDIQNTIVLIKNDALGWSNMQNRVWLYDINDSTLLTKASPASFTYTYTEGNFTNGIASINMLFDFNRSKTTPDNPFVIEYKDFNITDVHDTVNTYVAGSDFNRTAGNSNESNATFYYGRAKSSKYLYDDITSGSVVTPISVAIYNDPSTSSFAVDLATFKPTNEFDWYLATQHTAADGNLTLVAKDTDTKVNGSQTTTYSNIANGIFKDTGGNDVNVAYSGTTLPHISDINLTGTDAWLICNPDSNSEPNPFSRNRFIGISDWAGYGETGKYVDSNTSAKKNRRLGW